MSPYPPTPHGLQANRTLSKKIFYDLKLNAFLSSLPICNWGNVGLLQRAYLDITLEYQPDSKRARCAIKGVLASLARHKKYDLCLSLYCKALVKYLTDKSVIQEFDNSYTIQLSNYNQQKATKHQEDSLKAESVPEMSKLLNKNEKDRQTCLNASPSLGTRIKRAGIRHLQKFKQGNDLSPGDRKTMSSGLSSIIDFIDLSRDGQQSIFEPMEWADMVVHYTDKYKVDSVNIPKIACSALIAAEKLCDEEDISAARSYISTQKQVSGLKRDDIKSLELIDQAQATYLTSLIILQRHTFILDPLNAQAVTEYDYTNKISLPLFDSLFFQKNKIRTKIGESSCSTSSKGKKAMYPSSPNVHAFKIDVRFIFDRSGAVYDVASLEAAHDNEEAKARGDLGKLLREGKDVLDGLIAATIEEDASTRLNSWIIQISGLQGQISTIHLDSPGVYVAIPQFKINFPSCASSIGRFAQTIKALITFSRHLESTVSLIEQQITVANERRTSMGTTWNRPSEVIAPNPCKKWIRASWYSPPCNERVLARVPSNLFGSDDEGV